MLFTTELTENTEGILLLICREKPTNHKKLATSWQNILIGYPNCRCHKVAEAFNLAVFPSKLKNLPSVPSCISATLLSASLAHNSSISF